MTSEHFAVLFLYSIYYGEVYKYLYNNQKFSMKISESREKELQDIDIPIPQLRKGIKQQKNREIDYDVANKSLQDWIQVLSKSSRRHKPYCY